MKPSTTIALFVALAPAASVAELADRFEARYSGRFIGRAELQVSFRYLQTEEGRLVECWDGSVSEVYLERGSRALFIYVSVRDTILGARIARPGFDGVAHMPYLAPVIDELAPSGSVVPHGTFVMFTGGSTLNAKPPPVTIPLVSREETPGGISLKARDRGDVWAEVEQAGKATAAGRAFPRTSRETYRDGRGTFTYDWRLDSLKQGRDCPELPTFEEKLGERASVEVATGGEQVNFTYVKGQGSLEEQTALAREVDARLEKLETPDRTGVVLAAALAGLLTLAALAFFLRRARP